MCFALATVACSSGGDADGTDTLQGDATLADVTAQSDAGDNTPGAADGQVSSDLGMAMDGGGSPSIDAGPAADMGGGPSPDSLRDVTNFQATAPASFRALFTTSAGDFTVESRRQLAPIGVDRFYNLVRNGYFDGIRFFRVVPDFIVQFGIHGDPSVSAVWRQQNMADDPVVQGNRRGFLTYATAGPNTRTTQLFLNFSDNGFLDGQGFAAFGEVVEGMAVVDSINAQYGEAPNQNLIQQQGNAYLESEFPELDFIIRARVVE